MIKKEDLQDFKEAIGDRVSQFIETEYVFQELSDIPEGFSIEKIPENNDLDTEWGRLQSTFSVEGNIIRILQQFTAKPFSESKDRYGEYRDFARKVNKLYSASIVLVSSE